jgi:DnaJ-class molecular chaperone
VTAILEIVRCIDCHDEGACNTHAMRSDPVGVSVWCARCGGTGRFITGMLNGELVGPGGVCFRCSGKGFHTRADRRRNWKHSQFL